jgi:catechol 2,3-dioxygenase-like lactoylglutathione lyase family enzyme
MPAYSYDHVHLISADPEKAAQFYENAFGARRISAGPYPEGGSRVELSLQGTRLLIRTPRGEKQPKTSDVPRDRMGLEHWGIRTDNIEAAVADLKAKAVTVVDEIRVSQPTGSKIAFIMAPDNVLIEIVQPRGS